ncbi:MAG: GAK system XXXCH domain-containing protein [Thermodesulfobacteriota bacterium]
MDLKKIFLEETGKRKDEWQSGAEISRQLSCLAAEIADGVLIINGEKLALGDCFSLAIKKQLKKGKVSCEFLLKARLAQTATPPLGAEQEPKQAAAGRENVQRCPASGGKTLKKEISRLWKEVVKQVHAESVPPRELAADLRAKCEDFTLYAHNQWFAAWRACVDQVKACVAAAEKGDFATAREKISEVNHLTNECHRLYK